MKRASLKNRLADYFRKHHSMWIASGDLQRIVMQATSYTAQNVGRRLRELENENIIEVNYRKGHAYYRLTESARPRRQLVEEVANGNVRVTYQ